MPLNIFCFVYSYSDHERFAFSVRRVRPHALPINRYCYSLGDTDYRLADSLRLLCVKFSQQINS